MVKKPAPRKTSGLSMALTAKDRASFDKAAAILELPPSVWARSVLLKEAAKVIEETTK